VPNEANKQEHAEELMADWDQSAGLAGLPQDSGARVPNIGKQMVPGNPRFDGISRKAGA
jgi:hypothetical protein